MLQSRAHLALNWAGRLHPPTCGLTSTHSPDTWAILKLSLQPINLNCLHTLCPSHPPMGLRASWKVPDPPPTTVTLESATCTAAVLLPTRAQVFRAAHHRQREGLCSGAQPFPQAQAQPSAFCSQGTGSQLARFHLMSSCQRPCLQQGLLSSTTVLRERPQPVASPADGLRTQR